MNDQKEQDLKRMEFILRNPWRAIDAMTKGCGTESAYWSQEARDAIDKSIREWGIK